MKAVASMVTAGYTLCDVGTDHGYVPIALVQGNIIPKAIAVDINKGPLERANEHIRANGLTEQITTRLSNGLEAIHDGEVDSIVIAGMGGELVIHILTAGETVCRSAKELILQPQSEVSKVREYRDRGKRPLMGAVAAELADLAETAADLDRRMQALRNYLDDGEE